MHDWERTKIDVDGSVSIQQYFFHCSVNHAQNCPQSQQPKNTDKAQCIDLATMLINERY